MALENDLHLHIDHEDYSMLYYFSQAVRGFSHTIRGLGCSITSLMDLFNHKWSVSGEDVDQMIKGMKKTSHKADLEIYKGALERWVTYRTEKALRSMDIDVPPVEPTMPPPLPMRSVREGTVSGLRPLRITRWLWSGIHHVFAHPLMWLFNDAKFMVTFHDYTAKKAYGDSYGN